MRGRIRRLTGAVTVMVVTFAGVAALQDTSATAAVCPQVVCPDGSSSCCGSGGGGTTPSPVIPGVTSTPDGWLHYADSLTSAANMSNPAVKTLNGTFEANGVCDITDTSSDTSDLAAGSSDLYEIETAFDPSTCQEQVTSGQLTPAGRATLTQQEAADTQGATLSGDSMSAAAPTSTAGATPGASPAATSYQSAYIKTSWIDPVDITITSLTDDMKWPLYGAGGSLTAAAKPYEFKYDGWSSTGAKLGPFVTRPNNSGWSINATDKFTNSEFATFIYSLLGAAGWAACGFTFSVTAHFYHNITVYGYRNNTRNRSWSDKVDGACSNLVHHRESDGFGWK
jgi:hypothetical protein